MASGTRPFGEQVWGFEVFGEAVQGLGCRVQGGTLNPLNPEP